MSSLLAHLHLPHRHLGRHINKSRFVCVCDAPIRYQPMLQQLISQLCYPKRRTIIQYRCAPDERKSDWAQLQLTAHFESQTCIYPFLGPGHFMASEKNVGPNFRDEKSAANFPVEPAMVRKLVRLRLGGFPLRLEDSCCCCGKKWGDWLVGWLVVVG